MTNMTQAAINEIRELTETNYHTVAFIRLAEALKEDYLLDQLHMIEHRQNALGFISDADRQSRYNFGEWLMGKAAEVFDNFADIKAAF